MNKRHRVLTFALAALAWLFPAAPWAQAYPVKPVRYIVPRWARVIKAANIAQE